MYDKKLHETRNWQVVGFTFVSVGTVFGSLFIPIKPGEIPGMRSVLCVLAGGTLATGYAINASKEELDRQRAVIERSNTKVFVQGVAMDTALKLETVRNRCEDSLAKEMGVPEDANYK